MSAQARISAARQWLGVPFRAHGYDRSGIDCVWLTLAILRDAHDARIKAPEYDLLDSRLLEGMFGRHMRWRRHAQAGDFILVRPSLGEPPRHIGVVTGGTVIHCSPKRGVTEELYTPAWRRLTHSAWYVL